MAGSLERDSTEKCTCVSLLKTGPIVQTSNENRGKMNLFRQSSVNIKWQRKLLQKESTGWGCEGPTKNAAKMEPHRRSLLDHPVTPTIVLPKRPCLWEDQWDVQESGIPTFYSKIPRERHKSTAESFFANVLGNWAQCI